MSRAFHTEGATVPLIAGRPLLVGDADEVLLAFAQGFDLFLRQRGCYLDFSSYRLHGNVRRLDDNTALIDVEVTELLQDFRADLDSLAAIDGAKDAMAELSETMSIVVLSNVSITQAPARLRNFLELGWDFPLVTNSGSKGRPVKVLAKRAHAPTFFMDDTPIHHQSVAELAPEVFRIHFVGDERLKTLMPPSPHAHFRARSWPDARNFIRSRLMQD
jgi:hypothetical protein